MWAATRRTGDPSKKLRSKGAEELPGKCGAPSLDILPCYIVIGIAGCLLWTAPAYPMSSRYLDWPIFDHSNHLFRETGMKQPVRRMFGVTHAQSAKFSRLLRLGKVQGRGRTGI
jgi:hypothetical protein